MGPVTGAQLKSLAASGGLLPEDVVWNQSMTEWVPARRVKGLPFPGMPQAAKSPAPVRAAAAAARAAPVAAPVQAAPPPEPEEPAQPFMSDQPAPRPAARKRQAAGRGGQSSGSCRAGKTCRSRPPAEPFRTQPRTQSAMLGVPMNAVALFGRTRTPGAIDLLRHLPADAGVHGGSGVRALVQFDHARKFLTVSLQAKGEKFLRPTLLPLTNMHFLIVAGIYAFFSLIMVFLLGRYSSRIGKLSATKRQRGVGKRG